MKQLPLFSDDQLTPFSSGQAVVRDTFSHNGVANENARQGLEERYQNLFEETDKFDRRIVSFQGNKGQLLHSWIKYREGFSAELVDKLIDEFDIQSGDTLLEPFNGSGTTLLVAKSRGINAVGIEILPNCHLTWHAKSHVFDYDVAELQAIYQHIKAGDHGHASRSFPHLVITQTAFPDEAENALMYYTDWIEQSNFSGSSKVLLRLLLTSILEEVSYTRKDGQYLRWDCRAHKVQARNRKREQNGKPAIKGMQKGDLPSVKEALLAAMFTIIEDIKVIQQQKVGDSTQQLLQGSSLEILPTLEPNQFAGVITSPPYCNRYDYTRTYALEIAYLGASEQGIRELRQEQLSCTVEHNSKVNKLRDHYNSLDQSERFEHILQIIQNNPVFTEINNALQIRWDRGEINNRGILPMVEGYFVELTFIFAEILRTVRSGAHVAFVNDNVRYGGEIIPVDLLTTAIAEDLGFVAEKVYVLPQRKGNSSQQMGRFGREALRKSITIWKKP
jgi:site-specific DNA-methyltransferase (cytosine-N4-specific)